MSAWFLWSSTWIRVFVSNCQYVNVSLCINYHHKGVFK
uniref:Uncharacterized protein n=1 Tax=Rhizophora mucronata TaxID=61149 RepID=A0A2P2PUR0_RHIMU